MPEMPLGTLHDGPGVLVLSEHVFHLLGDVDAELARFRELGAFSDDVQQDIRAEFLPSSITDTLTIEGYRVNPRITRAVLEGQALSETDRYNEREVLNIIAANEYVAGAAKQEHSPALSDILEIHRNIYWLLDDSAGQFRRHDVTITGTSFVPPGWSQVPTLLDQGLQSLAHSTAHPVVQAAWIHWVTAAVHPFVDGNGRAARLTQDLILVRHDFLPVGIPAARREEYYDALETADHGDLEPLVEIVANAELTNLGRARHIADAPTRRMNKVRQMVRGAQNRVKRSDYLLYEVWRRRVDLFVGEVDRWIRDINTEATDLYFRIKILDPISFETWSEIRDRGRARNTWVFRVTVVIRDDAVYSVLFYARRHEWTWVLDQSEDERNAIGIFATGAPSPDFQFSFERYEDPFLRFREILILRDGERVFYGGDSEQVTDQRESLAAGLPTSAWSGRWVSQADLDLGAVVEHFLEDLLGKFGLLET